MVNRVIKRAPMMSWENAKSAPSKRQWQSTWVINTGRRLFLRDEPLKLYLIGAKSL